MGENRTQNAAEDGDNTNPVTPRRFFISYARGDERDVALARWLYDRLQAAGQIAFLDERQKLGTRWKDEIPKSIADSDVFIVLVSQKSVHSDAVQEEVWIARERNRDIGRPRFAPIRVAFTGDLGYVMGMYLRSHQWRDWRSEADSPRLLQELIELAGASGPPADAAISTPPRQLVPPIVAIESLRTPGGMMASDDPMYVTRAADAAVAARVNRQGETIVLLGPRQTGKSSLLNRSVVQAIERQKQIATVDFSLFDRDKFQTLPKLLSELARSFLHELQLRGDEAFRAVSGIAHPGDMTWFMEDHVLKAVNQPLTLVIDEVDKVFEQPYRSDFFGMIRAWHNLRSRLRSPWKAVDLVLAISTEPHLLMADRYQSPFNVNPPIRVTWFEPLETEQLNVRYGNPLAANEVERLHQFLGGQPYLTQLTLYQLVHRAGTSLSRYLLDAMDHDGDFRPHLDHLRSHLRERPELQLIEAFQQIVRFGRPPSEDTCYRLQAAGLVRRTEDQVGPTNELYARYFGNDR